MISLNSNVLAALDLETTGTIPHYHEITQVAILPLDVNLDPMDVSPFYMNIRAEHPERAMVAAMAASGQSLTQLEQCPDKYQVSEALEEWYQTLGLPMNRCLMPLTQNGVFDIPFMKAWLGEECYHRYFTFFGRDTLQLAGGLNDRAAWKGQSLPFSRLGLKSLANKLGVELLNHHDALADCLATAKVYREMLRMEL
jgi:DNA polymerase III epsilon subunit-like protein